AEEELEGGVERIINTERERAEGELLSKQFSLQTSRGTESVGKLCSQHQEPLKLFCEDDQALLCVVCDKSRGHRGHTVIPKEEAFGEYKVGTRTSILLREFALRPCSVQTPASICLSSCLGTF
uniref:B box-type domain-containing protein n=1 Tax=Salvator merianae TaxID=96440 RepID=A0A8D0DNP3_SALMN